MTLEQLQAEIDELRIRLQEANETVRAIQQGAVDAFVVEEPTGHRVYTLEAADRPYRLFVEQMQQGAATIDADGMIAYCNQRLADLLRTPREKLVGAQLRDFVVTEDRSAFDKLLSEGKAGSGRGEARLRRANDGVMPAHLTFNALPADLGGLLGVLVTDLTAQRHHEQLAFALDKLRISEQSLQEADRRKDEFLATLAHELRGPLAPLSNMLQVMKQTASSAEAPRSEHARRMMERQVAQLVRLVDDLLDVNRITRNKLELRREYLDLSSIVLHAVELGRTLPECDEHELVAVVPSEAIPVHADRVRLSQVFHNLLSNACKYTKRGGHISLNVERSGAQVVIRVKDTGIGIPSDKLPGVFDLFMQVDQSLEKSHGGLGIGLTLVKRLVEMHEGTVEAFSEGVGKGSEFVVRLPVLAEAADDRQPVERLGAASGTALRRILVVDDNTDSALSLDMLLKIAGHETRIAHDGLEAVAAAGQFRPDVVFLDIGLPKLNGFEAARRIRNQEWGQGMVLVALTGWGQEEDRRKSKDAGFDAHMVKPVDFKALNELLARPTEG